MWTLCFNSLYDGHLCADHWVQFNTKEELVEYLDRNHLADSNAAIVFPPAAYTLATTPARLTASHAVA